ncbi:MAG: hypothetical protein AAB229_09590 [Candidatus Hydrogenedentota bacterium]
MVFLAGSLILMIAAAHPVRAALEVSPVVVEAIVPADSSMSGAWSLKNTSDHALTVTATAISYVDYARGDRSAPAPPWLRIRPTRIDLPAGAESAVSWTIHLPLHARGESLALVFFEEKKLSRGNPMIGRIGTALYALAAGSALPSAAIRDVRVGEDGKGGEFLMLEIVNTGNVHFRPAGTFEVGTDSSPAPRDSEPRAVAVLVGGGAALPGSSTIFRTTAFPPLADGRHAIHWKLSTGTIDRQAGPVLHGDTVIEVRRTKQESGLDDSRGSR